MAIATGTVYGDWIYDTTYMHWRPCLTISVADEAPTATTLQINCKIEIGDYYINSDNEEDKTLQGILSYKVDNEAWITCGTRDILYSNNNNTGISSFFIQNINIPKTTQTKTVEIKLVIQGIKAGDFYWDNTIDAPKQSTAIFTTSIDPLKSYTITYNADTTDNVSNIPNSQTKYYGQDIILSTQIPTRTGYNFMGWKTISNGQSTYYEIGDNYTKNANATLYAVWAIVRYYITYELNGGHFGSNNNGIVETKSYGQSYTIISTVPTRANYDFNGWNTEPDGTGKTYSSNEIYEDNKGLLLYAQWQPESYIVSYDFNGGNSEVILDQSKDYDIPLVLTSKIPSKTGYAFINWNTLPDGTGDVYFPNDIYNRNEGIILYAQWREKSKGWINKIKLLTGSENDRVENEFILGATFDQVQYSENNAMTLLDFVNIIKKFFKSKMFMHYCGQEPTDNVMEGYQVVATNANPTKDELNAILG